MGAPSIPTPPSPPEPPAEPAEPADFVNQDDTRRKKNQVSATNLRVNVNAPGAGTNVPGS